jgi:hypothetical protein
LRRQLASRRQALAGRDPSGRDRETNLPRDLEPEGLAVVGIDAQAQDGSSDLVI